LTLKGSGRGQRLAALLVSGLLAALLVLSQSRGALLASLVAIPVVTVAINWRWLWLWVPLGLLGLGAALMGGLHIEVAALAVDTGSSISTLQGRAELWSRALYLMQDFPFTGVGLGMPEPVIKLLYPTFLTGPDSVWSHVHNTYLQVGSEMGLPGLIAYLALLLTVAAVLVRQLRRPQAGIYQGLSVGLLGSWSVFVVHSLVDAPTFSPIVGVSFFVLLGLMVAVATSKQRPGD
jgi:putative inorganic carbon (HCO3(-)) transporter